MIQLLPNYVKNRKEERKHENIQMLKNSIKQVIFFEFLDLEEEVDKQIDVVPSSTAKTIRTKRPKYWQAHGQQAKNVGSIVARLLQIYAKDT